MNLGVEHVDVAVADLAAGEVDEVQVQVVQGSGRGGKAPVAAALGELDVHLVLHDPHVYERLLALKELTLTHSHSHSVLSIIIVEF